MPELWEDPQAPRMAEQGFSTQAVQPQSKAKPSKDASLHWQSEAKLAKQRQETRVSKQKRLQRGNQSQTRRINPSANERRGDSKGNQDEVPTGSFTKFSHFISDALLLHWNIGNPVCPSRCALLFFFCLVGKIKERTPLCVFTEGFAYLSLFHDIDRLLVLRAMVLPRSTVISSQ